MKKKSLKYLARKPACLRKLTPEQWHERLNRIKNDEHRARVHKIVWWDYLEGKEPLPHDMTKDMDEEALRENLVLIGFPKRVARARARYRR